MTIRTPETLPAPWKPLAYHGKPRHGVPQYLRVAILTICLIQVVLFALLIAAFINTNGFNHIEGSYAYSPSKPQYLFESEQALYSLLSTILYLSFGMLAGLSLCCCLAQRPKTLAILLATQLVFTIATGISLAVFFQDVTLSFVNSMQFFQWNYQNPAGRMETEPHFKPVVPPPPIMPATSKFSNQDQDHNANQGCEKIDIENGYVWYKKASSLGQRPKVGDVAHVHCYTGFQLLGSGILECLPSGNYNESLPACASDESLRIQVEPPRIPYPDSSEEESETDSSEEKQSSSETVEIRPVLSVVRIQPQVPPVESEIAKFSKILNLIKNIRQNLMEQNEMEESLFNPFNRPRQGLRLGGGPGPSIRIVFVTGREMPGHFLPPPVLPQPPPQMVQSSAFPFSLAANQQLPFGGPPPGVFSPAMFGDQQPPLTPPNPFSPARQQVMFGPEKELMLPLPFGQPEIRRTADYNGYNNGFPSAGSSSHIVMMSVKPERLGSQFVPQYPEDISLDYQDPFTSQQDTKPFYLFNQQEIPQPQTQQFPFLMPRPAYPRAEPRISLALPQLPPPQSEPFGFGVPQSLDTFQSQQSLQVPPPHRLLDLLLPPPPPKSPAGSQEFSFEFPQPTQQNYQPESGPAAFWVPEQQESQQPQASIYQPPLVLPLNLLPQEQPLPIPPEHPLLQHPNEVSAPQQNSQPDSTAEYWLSEPKENQQPQPSLYQPPLAVPFNLPAQEQPLQVSLEHPLVQHPEVSGPQQKSQSDSTAEFWPPEPQKNEQPQPSLYQPPLVLPLNLLPQEQPLPIPPERPLLQHPDEVSAPQQNSQPDSTAGFWLPEPQENQQPQASLYQPPLAVPLNLPPHEQPLPIPPERPLVEHAEVTVPQEEISIFGPPQYTGALDEGSLDQGTMDEGTQDQGVPAEFSIPRPRELNPARPVETIPTEPVEYMEPQIHEDPQTPEINFQPETVDMPQLPASDRDWLSSFFFTDKNEEPPPPPPPEEQQQEQPDMAINHDSLPIHVGDEGFGVHSEETNPYFEVDEKRRKRSLDDYPLAEEPYVEWNHQADLEVVSVLGGLVVLIGVFLFLTIVSFVLILLALRQVHVKIQEEKTIQDKEAVESVTVVPVPIIPVEQETSKTEGCQTQKEDDRKDSVA